MLCCTRCRLLQRVAAVGSTQPLQEQRPLLLACQAVLQQRAVHPATIEMLQQAAWLRLQSWPVLLRQAMLQSRSCTRMSGRALQAAAKLGLLQMRGQQRVLARTALLPLSTAGEALRLHQAMLLLLAPSLEVLLLSLGLGSLSGAA